MPQVSAQEKNMISADNVKISVVMPIYNASDYLRPAIDSVLNQTLTDIELICVDDGSTDDSLSIIKEYQQQDDRVRIITENNAGFSAQEVSTLSSLTLMIFTTTTFLKSCIIWRRKSRSTSPSVSSIFSTHASPSLRITYAAITERSLKAAG